MGEQRVKGVAHVKSKTQEDVAHDDGDYDVLPQLLHVIQSPLVLVLLLLEVHP